MIPANEENNYPKALAISTGIMALFIAVSFFWVIGAFQPPEEVGMGGMVVNYGTSVTGMGTDYTSIEEPSADPNANNKAPDKITPDQQVKPTVSSQISDKNIATQNTEDAVSINTKDTKSNNAPTSAKEDKPSQPTINQNALYKGKKNNGAGQGDGTGNTPGNQGSINGDPLAPNYGEGGSGNGSTPVPLSRFTNVKAINDDGQKTGKIAVEIRVDRAGRVIYARAGVKGSTFLDKALLQKCEDAVMGASLDKMGAGYENRTFIVVFNFKVK
ncbi:MAG: energy transducer TonB [Bacteroidota bacterium]